MGEYTKSHYLKGIPRHKKNDLIIMNEDQLIAQIRRMVRATGTEVGKIRRKKRIGQGY